MLCLFVCAVRLCEAITPDMQFAGAHVTIFSLMPARAAANTNMTLKAARSAANEIAQVRRNTDGANKAEKARGKLNISTRASTEIVSASAIWYQHLSICDCQIRWLRKTKARAIKAVAPPGWEREAIKCHLGAWQLLLSVNSISAPRSHSRLIVSCQILNDHWKRENLGVEMVITHMQSSPAGESARYSLVFQALGVV